MELSVDRALQLAAEAHKSGRLQDAEQLYRAILQVRPRNPDANHGLGVLDAGAGDKAELALSHLRIAVDSAPQRGEFWISYINALANLGRPDQARRVLEQGRQLGLAGTAVDALIKSLQVDGSKPLHLLTPDLVQYQLGGEPGYVCWPRWLGFAV